MRSQLPVLFLIQDNHLAISTPTRGQTFYSRPDGEADTFYGMPIYRMDGRHVVTAWQQMQQGRAARCASSAAPLVVVFDVERLTSHTNADDETIYRSADEIRRVGETSDPIRNLEQLSAVLGLSEKLLDDVAARGGS